ncbi:MAG: hypothetical protein CMD08_03705 [Flavobacteriales bacterium]|nr:hypothetical protein [Flavobacteriales bacterium]
MILLCPGSAKTQKFKRWPIKKYTELGKRLKDSDYTVEFLIGSDEKELIPYLDDFEIHTELSLSEIYDLTSKIDLSICNDSFLMHFFSLFSTKTLAIYGPTDPNRTLPPGTLHIKSKIFSPTRPCWGKPHYGKCSKGICSCLDGLEVQDLFEEVFNILT